MKINGIDFKITFDPNTNGGSFSFNEGRIIIGTKDKHWICSTFLHEITEAILTMLDFRYMPNSHPDDNEYIFVFNHKQFDMFINELSGILEPLMKENFIEEIKQCHIQKDKEKLPV